MEDLKPKKRRGKRKQELRDGVLWQKCTNMECEEPWKELCEKNFYWTGKKFRSHCIPCHLQYMKEYQAKGINCRACGIELTNDNRTSKEDWCQNCRNNYRKEYSKNIPKRCLVNSKRNAKKKNIIYDLNLEHLIKAWEKTDGICPHCILPFYISNGNDNTSLSMSPSVDRIDSTGGYTKDNIIIVCWRANQIKSNSTLNEIKLIIDNWNCKTIDNFYSLEESKIKIRQLKGCAHFRAKKYLLEFNITTQDIKIPKLCPILHIPIFINLSEVSHNSPSIDRIDNTKGYTPDNIRVISWRANNLKKDATLEEYIQLYEFYKNLMKKD